MNEYTAGAVSGALATVPMTLVMSYLHRRLPRKEQHPLPPRRITMKIAQDVGISKSMKESEKFSLTMINHFGYGAATGALYFPFARYLKIPRIASGMIFGLGVWTVSYLGLLPATGLHPRATKDAPERNSLMIGAHLVWGACLGMLVDNFLHREKIAGFTYKRLHS